MERLNRIVARMAVGGRYDPQAALRALVHRLKQGEEAESELLQEALHTDIGGQS